MYYADHNTGRVSISRVELTETFDDGDFQLVHALGHADESFHKIGRNLPFGFGSHAPAGSVGHVLSVGGRRDARLERLAGDSHSCARRHPGRRC